MRRHAALTVTVPLTVLLAVAGCTGGPEPDPTGSATRAAASPTADADTVEVELEHAGFPLRVVASPVLVDGDRAVVTLEVSIPESAPEDSRFVPTIAFASDKSANDLGLVRVVDLDAGTVLLPGADERGRAVGTRGLSAVRPGESATLRVLVAAPAGDTVDILLPYVGLLRDVAVEDGDVPEPSELDVDDEVTYPRATLDVFTGAYDDGSTVRAEGEEATLTLAADVLFATDEFVLTDAAVQAVDQAAQQVLAAGSVGAVTVVGHTDDRASDEYNLDLSQKRATSVADRLRGSLGDAYPLTVEGRGEDEPVASGRSPEARAANRRVEIRFTVEAQEDVIAAGGAATAPEPQGPVGTGDDAVEFAVRDAVSTAQVTSVQRRDGYLVGAIEITRVSGGGDPVPGLLAQTGEREQGRGISGSVVARGAANVTLLGSSSRVFPVDYVVGEDDGVVSRAVLADQFLDEGLEDGRSMRVTVVWPDTGDDTVDVDVPFRFRITDVPVEG